MPSLDDTQAGHVQSVDRAVTILQFLARNGWSGVTEVGAEVGVHKSTAFRLLSTLEARGMVEQDVDSGKYHLGFGLVHLARAVSVGSDVSRQAHASLSWLAEESGETAALSVLEGDEAVTVDHLIPDASVVSRSWIGHRTPLHATAQGKVFLASLPASRAGMILAGPHEALTEHTITDPLALREEVAAVRERGSATSVEELEEGLSSVAAPIFAADGTVVAAMSVAAPSYRVDPDRLADLTELVMLAADHTSSRYGFVRPQAQAEAPAALPAGQATAASSEQPTTGV